MIDQLIFGAVIILGVVSFIWVYATTALYIWQVLARNKLFKNAMPIKIFLFGPIGLILACFPLVMIVTFPYVCYRSIKERRWIIDKDQL